jgi:hypothetical protein
VQNEDAPGPLSTTLSPCVEMAFTISWFSPPHSRYSQLGDTAGKAGSDAPLLPGVLSPRDPPMSPPHEIELKLDLPARSLPRLTGSALLNGAATSTGKPASLVSVYFDTDKLKLRRKGLSLRVRRIGRELVQTIKQENGASGTLLAVGKWEHEIHAKQPDLDAVCDTALGPMLNKKLQRSLKPVFETRVRRKVFQIQSGDSEVELSVDQGTVEAGRKSSPLCEVELGLKNGQVTDLFRLAKTLAQEVPARLTVKTKADRGYELLTAEKPEAVKAVPIALVPDGDVRSAFQIIARACLHQLLANEPVMLVGDPEGLHQMRSSLNGLPASSVPRASSRFFPSGWNSRWLPASRMDWGWRSPCASFGSSARTPLLALVRRSKARVFAVSFSILLLGSNRAIGCVTRTIFLLCSGNRPLLQRRRNSCAADGRRF